MIRMICGVYGHYVDGRVVPKDKTSKPFSLDPEQEARLVRVGVAAYVEEKLTDALPELPEGVTAVPAYSMETKADDLRKIAKQLGMTFPVGTTKAEMVAQMDAFLEEHTEDEGNLDDDVDMQDIEEAPTFDPAQAVQ